MGVRYLFLFAVAVAMLELSGCRGSEGRGSGTIVAEVGDKKLTVDMVPASVFSYGGQDSLTLLRAYAERWALQQAVYQYAEKHLSEKGEGIERLVEDYRQTLTVAEYEKKFVQAHLDTAVSKEEIAAFYAANPSHFKLLQPMARCLSVAVPQRSAQLKELRAVYAMRGEDLLDQVESLVFKAGVRLSTYPDAWVTVEMLERALGVDIPEGVLQQRPTRWEFTRDSMVYLMSFHEWREAGTASPLGYVAGEVKAILLNQRRKRMVDSLERSIVETGRVEGKVKIYAQ